MPSGAKKRKAARKKLEKEAHSFTKNNSNGSHHSTSQGSDDPTSRNEGERNIDPINVEKGENFEGDVVNNDHGKGSKESSFDADDDDATREFKSVTGKVSSSSSSTSSSSDDDEVVVEKDEPEEEALTTPDESVVASMENLVVDVVEESIPIEESVKEVVSPVSESAPVHQSLTSDLIESELESKQFVDEKSEVGSGVTDVIQEKIEEKVITPASGSENTSESVGVVVVRDTEVVSPQSSSDVKGEMPVTHKHAEQEPLLSTAPMPVRQTSIFNCCGLFEVFSGGSSSR